MKKLFIILTLITIIFSSCDHVNSNYILCFDGHVEYIDEEHSANDSIAYEEAFTIVETARCVDFAIEGATEGTIYYNEKYHDYNFVLYKITYTDSFKDMIQDELKYRSINDVINSYLIRYDGDKLAKKYKLSLSTVHSYVSHEYVSWLMKFLYEDENNCFDNVFNEVYETMHKYN